MNVCMYVYVYVYEINAFASQVEEALGIMLMVRFGMV